MDTFNGSGHVSYTTRLKLVRHLGDRIEIPGHARYRDIDISGVGYNREVSTFCRTAGRTMMPLSWRWKTTYFPLAPCLIRVETQGLRHPVLHLSGDYRAYGVCRWKAVDRRQPGRHHSRHPDRWRRSGRRVDHQRGRSGHSPGSIWLVSGGGVQ